MTDTASLMNSQVNTAMLQARQDIETGLEKHRSAGSDLQAIEEAAQDFEAVFITEMLKPMFKGIETDGMFGGGKGEEIFRGQMLQEYGKIMAENGGIGLADQIKQEMIRMQEQADSAAMPSAVQAYTGMNTGTQISNQ